MYQDIVTQLKRNLDGFWVAHPDFIRIGLAIVSGWSRRISGDSQPLRELITSLLNEEYHSEIFEFIEGADIVQLDVSDLLYARSLIVADLAESQSIANNDPEEVRYNVFQSLQYLADWLAGNGCVALPARLEGVSVRVMDDLATAERSRWEVWHEVHYGRFSLDDLLKIAHEEYRFIRDNLSTTAKIVQVKWTERTAKWYPVAFKLMIYLMTSSSPPEFATELLLPFTLPFIRDSDDPLSVLQSIDTDKLKLNPYVKRYCEIFVLCGSPVVASALAGDVVFDARKAVAAVQSVSAEDLRSAAQWMQFEASVSDLAPSITIALKSVSSSKLADQIQSVLKKHSVIGASMTISSGIRRYQNLAYGTARGGEAPVTTETIFEVASLSKAVASCFAVEFFRSHGISLNESANAVLSRTTSPFRVRSGDLEHVKWGDEVTIAQLMNHSALNMHYVNGIPLDHPMPPTDAFLEGNEKYGYVPIRVPRKPGTVFGYSGGGFVVLEHILEVLSGKPIAELTMPFLKSIGMNHFSFDQKSHNGFEYATGYTVDGVPVEGGRKMHPACAAGGLGTAQDIAIFLTELTAAYQDANYRGVISHDTAIQMLYGIDLGSQSFMGASMGLGIFVADAGPNRIAIHQGANEGFRSLFMHCFSGPDVGKGFVMHCNAELNGVLCISEIAQLVLCELEFEGVDVSKFKSSFVASEVPPEQIVNTGYKELIFTAFEPDLPERVPCHGQRDVMSDYNLCLNGKILSVTNQRFARAENLLSPYAPVFDPELFGRQGKIMDSWETVRHNKRPCDVLIFSLCEPSAIRFASISTQYHLGNQPESVSVEGRRYMQDSWVNIVPKLDLKGHSLLNVKTVNAPDLVFSDIRVCIFPDGGLSRLGLYSDSIPERFKGHFVDIGEAKPQLFAGVIPKTCKPLAPRFVLKSFDSSASSSLSADGEYDVASLATGGSIVRASNEHYGLAIQILSPYPPLSMFDGLESARSRNVGHFEDVIINLAYPCVLHRIEVDFTYFVNNNPNEMSIDAKIRNDAGVWAWRTIVERTFVKPYAGNTIELNITLCNVVEEIKVVVYPDGGFNRIRVYTLK
jgi:allantoicase/CubicO group peptidase (beta-lactamase class C family)